MGSHPQSSQGNGTYADDPPGSHEIVSLALHPLNGTRSELDTTHPSIPQPSIPDPKYPLGAAICAALQELYGPSHTCLYIDRSPRVCAPDSGVHVSASVPTQRTTLAAMTI